MNGQALPSVCAELVIRPHLQILWNTGAARQWCLRHLPALWAADEI